VALSGVTVAVIVAESPSVRESSVFERDTDATSMILAMTVTEHVAVKPPSSDLAVTVVDPGLTAVILPLFTVTTDPSLLAQITFWLSASEGETVATRSDVSPSVRVMEVGLILMPDTLTGCGSLTQDADKRRQKPNRNRRELFFMTESIFLKDSHYSASPVLMPGSFFEKRPGRSSGRTAVLFISRINPSDNSSQERYRPLKAINAPVAGLQTCHGHVC
jgi:hypothetical protein